MAKLSFGRIVSIVFFLVLLLGAVICFQRLAEDVTSGKYFNQPQEIHYDAVFLISYILIIILLLRFGYYLAVNRVSWRTVRGDFIYLLNRKYFTGFQWALNVLLFWLALIGFIYSLAISAMKGNL